MRHNWDAFGEVVKATILTGMWHSVLAWYSPSPMSNSTDLLQWLRARLRNWLILPDHWGSCNPPKFLEPSCYFTTINSTFKLWLTCRAVMSLRANSNSSRSITVLPICKTGSTQNNISQDFKTLVRHRRSYNFRFFFEIQILIF